MIDGLIVSVLTVVLNIKDCYIHDDKWTSISGCPVWIGEAISKDRERSRSKALYLRISKPFVILLQFVQGFLHIKVSCIAKPENDLVFPDLYAPLLPQLAANLSYPAFFFLCKIYIVVDLPFFNTIQINEYLRLWK